MFGKNEKEKEIKKNKKSKNWNKIRKKKKKNREKENKRKEKKQISQYTCMYFFYLSSWLSYLDEKATNLHKCTAL